MKSSCIRGFAEALEVIRFMLDKNVGMNPITIVMEIRNRHENDEINPRH